MHVLVTIKTSTPTVYNLNFASSIRTATIELFLTFTRKSSVKKSESTKFFGAVTYSQLFIAQKKFAV